MAKLDGEVVPLSNSARWLKPYQSALLETDRSKLPKKILEAEAALFKRKLQLRHHGPLRSEAEAEKAAINDALLYLVILREDLQR